VIAALTHTFSMSCEDPTAVFPPNSRAIERSGCFLFMRDSKIWAIFIIVGGLRNISLVIMPRHIITITPTSTSRRTGSTVHGKNEKETDNADANPKRRAKNNNHELTICFAIYFVL
jgi:hypothetical protein